MAGGQPVFSPIYVATKHPKCVMSCFMVFWFVLFIVIVAVTDWPNFISATRDSFQDVMDINSLVSMPARGSGIAGDLWCPAL